MGKCIIYTRNNLKVPISTQFQECRKYAFKKNLFVAFHIDDTTGDRFNEVVNLMVANQHITTLIIYSKNIAFDNMEDYLFYCIYFVKQNKELLTVKI